MPWRWLNKPKIWQKGFLFHGSESVRFSRIVSIHLSIYQSIYLSINQSIFLSICLYIYLYISIYGARSFAINSLAIKISCYQPPVLSNSTINPVVITFLCYQAVLRIWIRWIRKILASWIRIRKNMRSCFLSIYLTRCQLLDIYIPVLVNLLQTEEAGISSKSRHEMALMRLTRVGAQYPADFKVN